MFQKHVSGFRSEKALRSCFYLLSGILAAYCVAAGIASAASGGSDLPFMGPLDKLKETLSGPYAFAVSIIGIIAAGVKLIMDGGEMGQFMKVLLGLVIVIGLVVGANAFMTSFMGASAVISTALSPEQTGAVMKIVTEL